jgi:hypothetical protein
MEELFPEVKILESGRSATADFQRILVIGDRNALLCRQDRDIPARDLMRLAAFAAQDRGVAELSGFPARRRPRIGCTVRHSVLPAWIG